MQYKDFYIAVGKPGAYSASMAYDTPTPVYETYGCLVKHAPYSIMAKIKNVVTQSWLDEDGDDVYLPQSSNGRPAIVHEAVDYTVQFVFHHSNVVGGESLNDYANQQIRRLVSDIEGRWLKIYDSYTGIGFDGVYLQDVDDDPRFHRRGHDTVIFELNFKVNGRPLDVPLA